MTLYVATLVLVVLFTVCGVFSIAAGIAGWDWFFNSVNVRILTGKLRRPLARLLYIVLGLAILAMAIYMYNVTAETI